MWQLAFDLILECFDRGCVVGFVENYQKRQAVLSELFGIFKGDNSDRRRASFVGPRVQLGVSTQLARVAELGLVRRPVKD